MKMLILGEILDYILASQRYQHFEAEMSLENVKTISFSDIFESKTKNIYCHINIVYLLQPLTGQFMENDLQ